MKKIIILVLMVVAFASATDIDSSTFYFNFMTGMGKCEFTVLDDTSKFFFCEHGHAVFWFEKKCACMSIDSLDNAKTILGDDVYEELKAEKVNKLTLCFKGTEKKENMRIAGEDIFGVDVFATYFREKTTIYELYRTFKLITIK